MPRKTEVIDPWSCANASAIRAAVDRYWRRNGVEPKKGNRMREAIRRDYEEHKQQQKRKQEHQ